MVGKKIRELRKANGFTQRNVAVLLGLSQVNISHWELGKAKIPDYWLEKLADLFCVDKDLLFGIADGEYVEDVVSREWHDEQVLMLLRERDNLADYAKCLKKEVDSLTEEIERLKKINEELYYSGLNENTARLCDMQKIDRLKDKVATLTEEVERLQDDLFSYHAENTELCKQVDDLMEERENLQAELIATEDARLELKKQVDELSAFKEEAISMNLYEKGRKDGEEVGRKQAVKDTAKEIYELMVGEYEIYIDTKIAKEIAERYGVEVE